ncbi:ubiquitin-conjugating enzyme E2 J1, partial [Paragonimus westermani]
SRRSRVKDVLVARCSCGMSVTYNTRNPGEIVHFLSLIAMIAVKRLLKEAQELSEPTELYHAQPLEDNLFEWHFTIRGPEDTEFSGGLYHGRILLPSEYPMRPPNIVLLT